MEGDLCTIIAGTSSTDPPTIPGPYTGKHRYPADSAAGITNSATYIGPPIAKVQGALEQQFPGRPALFLFPSLDERDGTVP
jgi:hypothetical protein